MEAVVGSSRCRDAFIVGAAEMRGKLQALGFATGESCRGLSEAQVAETISFKTRSLETILGTFDEKCERFADRQLQNLVDILAVIADFRTPLLKRVPRIPANEFDVREKLHFTVTRPSP